MKNSYNSIIFVLAAVILTTLLFAFKAEDPKQEYGTIQFFETSKKDAIIVNVSGTVKMTSTDTFNDEKKFLEILNGLASEGWVINSTDYTSTGSFTKRIVYLQKLKQ